MQRSGRKRLYDHNLFLASLFEGKISHKIYGDMMKLFKKAIFIDIGSGILCDEGAPTVRDIVEDDRIWVHLDFVVATDINGQNSRYVDIYRTTKRNIPFPVLEVGMKMNSKRDFVSLAHELLKPETAVIFRSANSGPDLYYEPDTLIDHFRAMIQVYKNRNVIYLFNKFVLFKGKNDSFFQKIGVVDHSVGMSHRGHPWEKIDWEKRKLKDAFSPNPDVIEVKS
jgi:hypothetical protein